MAQRPENEPKAIDWPAAQRQLRTAPDGDQADDLIDALTDAVFAGAGTAEAAPVLAQAVQRAHSEFSLRSAALALSVTASADDANAVDALVAAYRRAAEHSFLAPSLLEALGLLAPRSPLARAQLTALLLRLHAEDSRYLLMKAAQVIGCLDAVRPEPDLRAKLAEFSAAQDSAVQAEVRQQLALMELADALLVEDKGALQARLSSARAAFARAELSEEHRPDAAMFVRVLDMLLLFPGLSLDRAATVRGLVEVAAALDHSLSSLMPYDWHDYRSDRATARARRILHIADALRRAAQGVGAAEEWTNFAAALEELARLHAQIRAESSAVPDDGRIPAALGSIADAVFATSLGPLLSHVVQARRLARITADRALAHGEDDITQGLRALEQAAAAAAFAADPELLEGVAGQLTELAKQIGCRPEILLVGAIEAMQQRRVAQWAEEVGLASGPLPIERAELYGNEPEIDEVVRPALHQIADQLGDYPLPQWARLVDMFVGLVKFAQYVRDRTPPYVVCEEDGGLGQHASERNLQDHLFEWLRQMFGRTAVYEFARSGGGRPDTGVVFPEARFPAEAKHEFESIAPEHVRESFVAQSDVYATSADRVSFLMILDLRASNAAGHLDRMRAARKAGHAPMPVGLYHLRDSFRVETLPTDLDVPNATSKVVVVGLLPGNRPLPSSMSTYSRRPASLQYARTPRAHVQRDGQRGQNRSRPGKSSESSPPKE